MQSKQDQDKVSTSRNFRPPPELVECPCCPGGSTQTFKRLRSSCCVPAWCTAASLGAAGHSTFSDGCSPSIVSWKSVPTFKKHQYYSRTIRHGSPWEEQETVCLVQHQPQQTSLVQNTSFIVQMLRTCSLSAWQASFLNIHGKFSDWLADQITHFHL